MKNHLIIFLALGLTSCAASKKLSADQQLEELYVLMSGTFTSAAQAAADEDFYDITLTMVPIWETNTEAKWLYVEQAVSQALDKPYRQRVYRVAYGDDGQIESRVYELPEPEDFVHAWEMPEKFRALRPDQLVLREGCSVFLTRQRDGSYSGATLPNTCGSTLRGATYATSQVDVKPGVITSWDQGWNAEGEQVWGAEKSGYIFVKE